MLFISNPYKEGLCFVYVCSPRATFLELLQACVSQLGNVKSQQPFELQLICMAINSTRLRAEIVCNEDCTSRQRRQLHSDNWNGLRWMCIFRFDTTRRHMEGI